MASLPERPGATSCSIHQVETDLGSPAEAFKPGKENLFAGVILAMLSFVAGLALVFWMAKVALDSGGNMPLIATTKGPSWLALAFGVVGGVMMVVMAIYFIILVRFLSPLSVYVCRDGFFTVYREKPGVCRIDVFRWDQIDWVQETVKQEYFPLKGVAKYAAPMGKYRSYLVHRKDGLEFVFDGDTVKKVGKLARLVQKQINERGIPWHVVA